MIRTERIAQADGGYIETSSQEQSSVVIKRNNKGEFSWEMKIYKDDPTEFENIATEFMAQIDDVVKKAKRLGL